MEHISTGDHGRDVSPHTVGSIIRFSWETFKKRPWFLIGVTVLLFIVQMCVGLLTGIIDAVGEAAHAQAATGLISFLVSTGSQVLVGMGFIAFYLKAHDGIETVQVSDAWHPQHFWKFLGTIILLYVIVIFGVLLFIIPGIIAMLAFMFAPYLVIEKGLGPIEALKESARMTYGNRWRLLALQGGLGLVTLLGVLAFLSVSLWPFR
jgi:uncharacterized membrane protein